MSFVLKTNCLEACLIRGDYEYDFWDANLTDFNPMETLIRRRPAFTAANWEVLGPMELPMTRYMLTAFQRFDMRNSMSFQEFLAGSFPDTEAELR
jgi:hypothetical protein